MNVPLVIDEAAYQDILVRENNTYSILLEFIDSDGIYIDLTDYTIKMLCFEKGRQTTPAIEFASALGDFVNTGIGNVLWNIAGIKTINKQGSYLYHIDLVHNVTNNEATFMYGMFTVINKNG